MKNLIILALYLPMQLYLLVFFISSYDFRLLSSILSFLLEGLLLAFLTGWVYKLHISGCGSVNEPGSVWRGTCQSFPQKPRSEPNSTEGPHSGLDSENCHFLFLIQVLNWGSRHLHLSPDSVSSQQCDCGQSHLALFPYL